MTASTKPAQRTPERAIDPDTGLPYPQRWEGTVFHPAAAQEPAARPLPDRLRSVARFVDDCFDNLDKNEVAAVSARLRESADCIGALVAALRDLVEHPSHPLRRVADGSDEGDALVKRIRAALAAAGEGQS